MISVKYILMPVLGGIIGYITNDIAIKMLFRPRKPVCIGKWKLPFTPGLIPRQKDRIAHSIGNVVSAQLLNAETVRASVLSEESLEQLRARITAVLDGFADRQDTIQCFAVRYIGREAFDNTEKTIRENVERIIVQKMKESDIGAALVVRGVQLLKDRLKDRLNIGLQAVLFSKEFMGQFENMMASVINDFVDRLAPDIIHTEIQKVSEDIQNERLCDLYQEHQDRIPQLVDRIVALYEKALEENMEKLIQAVDIGGIVYKKVAAFDAEELENLIFGIMKKELKAIVYLGALLGFLMGFLNILLL